MSGKAGSGGAADTRGERGSALGVQSGCYGCLHLLTCCLAAERARQAHGGDWMRLTRKSTPLLITSLVNLD